MNKKRTINYSVYCTGMDAEEGSGIPGRYLPD